MCKVHWLYKIPYPPHIKSSVMVNIYLLTRMILLHVVTLRKHLIGVLVICFYIGSRRDCILTLCDGLCVSMTQNINCDSLNGAKYYHYRKEGRDQTKSSLLVLQVGGSTDMATQLVKWRWRNNCSKTMALQWASHCGQVLVRTKGFGWEP